MVMKKLSLRGSDPSPVIAKHCDCHCEKQCDEAIHGVASATHRNDTACRLGAGSALPEIAALPSVARNDTVINVVRLFKTSIALALLIVLIFGVADPDLISAAGKTDELRQTCLRILTEGLHHKLFNVRSAAAKALGESRDEAAVPLLSGVLPDQDSMVKSFAVEALGEIGSQAPPAGRRAATDGLVQASKDPDGYIRGLAFKALGDMNDATFDPLFRQGMNDPDPGVRFLAAVGLAKRGDQKAVETVIQVLRNPRPENRAIAAGFLAGSKQPEILHALIQALGDSDAEVRAAAAASLGNSGDPNSLEPLIQRLQDEAPSVRVAAAEAVGGLKQPKSIPSLKNAMKDRDPLVRISAAQGLALLSVTDGQRYLKTALSDNDYDVRASAARALGRIQDRDALPLLAKTFKDPVSRVRIATARALGMIGGQEAVKILRTGLSDPDLSVQNYAAGNILRSLSRTINKKKE